MGGTAVEGGRVPDEAVRPVLGRCGRGVVGEVAAVVARHPGLLDGTREEGGSSRHSAVAS